MVAQPQPLDLNKPVPTYEIDRLMLNRIGPADYEFRHSCHSCRAISVAQQSPRWSGSTSHRLFQSIVSGYRYDMWRAQTVRSAFNFALGSARWASYKPQREQEWVIAKERTDALFADIKRLWERINKTDLEHLLQIAMPAEPFIVGERLLDYGEDPQAEIEAVDQARNELRAAIERFLASVYIPHYLPHRRGGHHDWLVSTYISVLAKDSRLWPFTPVTPDNYTDFARLLTAGWEDLQLPLDYTGYGKRNYDSLYEMIYERVRKHPDLKSRISPPKNS
jgi:hypothetical protein